MTLVVDVAGSQALERQVRRTADAITRGRPADAASERQRSARRRYRRLSARPDVEYVPEGYVGSDDMLWSSFLARGADVARAVGRVSWAAEPAQSRANGTGFLVGPDLMMTNHHVVPDRDAALATVLELDYEYGADGGERRAHPYALDPDRFFSSSPDLDYTLVAVGRDRAGRAVPASRPRIELVERTGKASNGDPLNVVHHPVGRRKTITIRASHLHGLQGDNAAYTGDTLGGSSGAPIFNDQWELVALHFGGKPLRDAEGRLQSRDGGVWTPAMGASAKAYEYNLGVRTSRIVADLRAEGTPDAVLTALLPSGGSS